ncbi:unnamed protein product [Prorocentrum cordatum]|uniref:Uncharacterized protein n=1 Tax=Prorocentrum cordatum TaxID=2364126 RepID=A0ABN9UKX8_9DINO|nr:unnamed protein product [Polarella glacialis]
MDWGDLDEGLFEDADGTKGQVAEGHGVPRGLVGKLKDRKALDTHKFGLIVGKEDYQTLLRCPAVRRMGDEGDEVEDENEELELDPLARWWDDGLELHGMEPERRQAAAHWGASARLGSGGRSAGLPEEVVGAGGGAEVQPSRHLHAGAG